MADGKHEDGKPPWLSDKQYDFLKDLALKYLPGLGTLYFALAGIWGLPEPEKVLGTIVAICTFLGVLLHLSSKSYENAPTTYDGDLNVFDDDEGNKSFSVGLNVHPEVLVGQKTVTFKVNPINGDLAG